jgi:ribosomal protein S8
MSIFAFGCATTGVIPEKTQLQIREFQTRTYETNDTKMVMKAMLNVLQDEGFIVKNAVVDLGLLSAEKQVDVESKSEAFWAAFFLGAQATWKKAYIIECSANVSEFGTQTRVRVNFQSKILDNKGGIREIKQIEDEKYYQEFFSKVDKGIFIQKEKL